MLFTDMEAPGMRTRCSDSDALATRGSDSDALAIFAFRGHGGPDRLSDDQIRMLWADSDSRPTRGSFSKSGFPYKASHFQNGDSHIRVGHF